MTRKATNAENKILTQFKRFIETNAFKEEILIIRKTLGLPEKGLPLPKDKSSEYLMFKPFPEESEYTIDRESLRFKIKSPYPPAVKKLLSMFPIVNPYIKALLRNYIYYNLFFYEDLLETHDSTEGICRLSDADEEYDNYSLSDEPDDGDTSVESHNKHIVKTAYEYPVVIRIHPQASQRDILEFIKDNWSIIEETQSKFLVKESKFSIKNSKTKVNKKIKERNEFIFNNQHLSRKDIAAKVLSEFGQSLDHGNVGKIISLMKKRKEV